MSFCSYSSSTHSGSFLVIENTFIKEYLPYAPDMCVKVYLYGLSMCNNQGSVENSVENFCHVLNITVKELKDIFEYWQGEGLVQILENGSGNNLDVKYLPVIKRVGSSKIRKDKYTDFNSKLQAVINERMITPTEYNEYYTLIESMHLDQNALIEIASYCVQLKGGKVGYPYIITVCKSFIDEGLFTLEQVKEKLSEHQEITPELLDITKAFGKKTALTLDDRNNYIKWTKEFGFTHGTIKDVAKSIKGKNPTIALLNTILTNYYDHKLLSTKEINEYNENREKYIALAKDITHTIGLRYDNYDTIVENYILDWIAKGFDAETLKTIAMYCLKSSTRTIEGMNTTILKFYKLGLISASSINQYIEGLISTDNLIKEILETLKLDRLVNTWDRESYKTWTEVWGFSHEIVKMVAKNCSDKLQPMQQMNKLLSLLHENKIEPYQDAETFIKNNSKKTTSATKSKQKDSYIPSTTRDYKNKDLNALFDNLDNIEI